MYVVFNVLSIIYIECAPIYLIPIFIIWMCLSIAFYWSHITFCQLGINWLLTTQLLQLWFTTWRLRDIWVQNLRSCVDICTSYALTLHGKQIWHFVFVVVCWPCLFFVFLIRICKIACKIKWQISCNITLNP